MQPLPPPGHLGPYRVVRLLGRATIGELYLAADPLMKRPVAIKVPRGWLVGVMGKARDPR